MLSYVKNIAIFKTFLCLLMIGNREKRWLCFQLRAPVNCKSKFEPAFRFAEKIPKNQGEEGSGTAKKQKKSEKA